MRAKELRPTAKWFFLALLVTLVAATSAWAAHEKVLHNFVALPHGAYPQANVVADAAGNLYGTTPNGGKFGYGTVFELTHGKNGKWDETVLYSFTGGSDGAIPVAGLVFDTAGNLYGTTATGGTVAQDCYYSYKESSCGVVFQLSPGAHGTWTETVLHSFAGYPNDGQTPVASLVLDSAGNLYGTTQNGGAYDQGEVFELTRTSSGTWTEKILYDFAGAADGGNPLASLIFDSAGNLYGTTEYGGDINCNPEENNTTCGTVFELTPNGNATWSETVLHTFTYVDGAYPMSNLVFDSAGNLYGTAPQGPGFACYYGGCGIVFRLTPSSGGTWTETMIYNFEGGPDGVEPVAGLVLDDAGNLYGTTQYGGSDSCSEGCGTVFELTPRSKGNWTEKVIHRFAVPAHGGNDGVQPVSGLFLDEAGILYGTAQSGGSLGGTCSLTEVSHGCGTVFKLMPASGQRWTTTLVYAFPHGSQGLGPKSGLLPDAAGNMYGATGAGGENNCLSDGGCGTVFELKPQSVGGWKHVVLHTFNGIDGAGLVSSLISDSSGNLYGATSNGGSSDCLGYYAPCGGTVFELSPTTHGWKETVLHAFHNKAGTRNGDGGSPQGGLVMDSAGSLYGTTAFGGSHSSICTNQQYIGCGTVYKLSPVGAGKWKEELLYTFQGGSDGDGPLGTLVFDEAGNLYGTTSGGGASGNGTVFKLAPNSGGKWSESILYSFRGSANGDGVGPLAGVIFDHDGDLFGTTFRGGSYAGSCTNSGCGVVFELSPNAGADWKETVIHRFRGTDGLDPQSALTLDSAGNLYGAALYTGTNYSLTSGTVFELSPSSKGWTEHVLHYFGKGFDGAGPDSPLIFDSAGNILGTTIAGGTDGSGTVFELSPGLDEQWADDLFTAPRHPSRFMPPYFKLNSTRDRNIVRSFPHSEGRYEK